MAVLCGEQMKGTQRTSENPCNRKRVCTVLDSHMKARCLFQSVLILQKCFPITKRWPDLDILLTPHSCQPHCSSGQAGSVYPGWAPQPGPAAGRDHELVMQPSRCALLQGHTATERALNQ